MSLSLSLLTGCIVFGFFAWLLLVAFPLAAEELLIGSPRVYVHVYRLTQTRSGPRINHIRVVFATHGWSGVTLIFQHKRWFGWQTVYTDGERYKPGGQIYGNSLEDVGEWSRDRVFNVACNQLEKVLRENPHIVMLSRPLDQLP